MCGGEAEELCIGAVLKRAAPQVSNSINFSYIECDRQGALDRHWIYTGGFDNLSSLAKNPNQAMLPLV
jgi:hypothetical protein